MKKENIGLKREYKKSVEQELSEIESKFSDFLNGNRVIILMHRQKDGGHGKEYQRRTMSYATHDKESALRFISKCLIIKNESTDPLRIYITCNSRNLKKAERNIKTQILEMDYSGEETKRIFYERFERNWHSALMQESARETPYFLIDVDNIEDRDTSGENLKELARLNVEVINQFKTKNGWHIVTKPFNPALYQASGEIKKDGQLLLSY